MTEIERLKELARIMEVNPSGHLARQISSVLATIDEKITSGQILILPADIKETTAYDHSTERR